jgi:cytochrome c-type biogenesis protein CcmE
VDLTPRTHTELGDAPGAPAPAPGRKGRRWLPAAVVGALLVGGAVVLFQGLTNATVYFCNANEVGAKSGCEPGERFRLQGTVVDGSIVYDEAETRVVEQFLVAYGGVEIPVTYNGDPAGIFQENIPVVVEGRMGTDGQFAGDRILVRHTEQYREENPNRTEDYSESEGS